MNKDLRVTLFSNSAPVFYTVNGKAYCDYLPDDENYVTNLEPERYADFAKYSIACAKHFTEAGYRVTACLPSMSRNGAGGVMKTAPPSRRAATTPRPSVEICTRYF